jgi:hypothetical protein
MYNTLFKYAVFVMLTCVFASCWNEEPEATLPTAFVVGGDLSNIPVAGGVYYLTITSTTPVEVTSSESWCKTEISENGAKVTIEPNPTVNARAATILVKGVVNVSKPAVQVGAPKLPVIVGNWQFPASNILAANIGADLEKSGDGFTQKAGPNGRNAVTVAKGSYFLAKHGLLALGGTKVNEYTIMWDVHMDWVASWYSLFNSSVTNSNDGDLWIAKGSRQIGVAAIGGYVSNVFPSDDAWYRIVLSVKLGESIKIYIDGVALDKAWSKLAQNDTKYGWDPAGVLLFADNAGDDGNIDVTEVTIWDQAMTDAEVATIGKVGDPYLP